MDVPKGILTKPPRKKMAATINIKFKSMGSLDKGGQSPLCLSSCYPIP